MADASVTIAAPVPFHTIPAANNMALFSVQAGLDIKYARETTDLILSFLQQRALSAVTDGLEDEEPWVHWFLLGMVEALRRASGDVQ